jgi:hypothetical protein
MVAVKVKRCVIQQGLALGRHKKTTTSFSKESKIFSMKKVSLLLAVIVSISAGYDLRTLSTSNASGDTVVVNCEYMVSDTIAATFAIETDDKQVTLRTKSGSIVYNRSQIISIKYPLSMHY